MNKLYYSYFDMDHFEHFNRLQWAEPTSLALDNFRRFSSNPTKFSMVIENAMGYGFTCKSLIRRSHGCLWVGKCKISPFRNSTQLSGIILDTGPRSAVGNLSDYRCLSDCRSRGHQFDPGQVPYYRGD